MKIEQIQKAIPVREANKTNRLSPMPKDQLSVSSGPGDVEKFAKMAQALPDVRADKVAAASGALTPEAMRVLTQELLNE